MCVKPFPAGQERRGDPSSSGEYGRLRGKFGLPPPESRVDGWDSGSTSREGGPTTLAEKYPVLRETRVGTERRGSRP